MKMWEPSQMEKDHVAFYWFMVNASYVVLGLGAVGSLVAFLFAVFT